MSTIGRLALVAGAATLVSAFGVTPSMALSADASPRVAPKCDAHYVCLHSEWAGDGKRCQYTRSQRDLTSGKFRCSFAPEVRSVTNRRAEYVHLYPRKDYKGEAFACVAPGHTVNVDRSHKTFSMTLNHVKCR